LSRRISLIALDGLPEVEPGADLAALIADAAAAQEVALRTGDALVVAQKIVSKAENRYVRLGEVEASPRALELAPQAAKDPRLVELILRESTEVLRCRPGALIVRHRLGYVHANAGIDQSNIRSDDTDPRVLLLPADPDRSARELRERIAARCGAEIAVIINDSAGRAWRHGVTGFALGTAGFTTVENRIGEPDLFGRPLQITEVAVADELAAAASYLMGQAAEGRPVVLVRGARLQPSAAGSGALIRPLDQDLFR